MNKKYKIAVLSRCVVAILGGYLLSSLFSVAYVKVLVAVFHFPHGDSVLIATMFAYLVYFVVFILCFCPFGIRSISTAMTLSCSTLWLINSLYSMS